MAQTLSIQSKGATQTSTPQMKVGQITLPKPAPTTQNTGLSTNFANAGYLPTTPKPAPATPPKTTSGMLPSSASSTSSSGTNYTAPTGTITKVSQDAGHNPVFQTGSDGTPVGIDTTSNANRVIGAGQQTEGEKQALQRLYDASGQNSLATGATQAEALYGMLGNQAKLQPFAGGQTQGLLNSYANLTRPQSTGNLAGETGLFDVQRGILQNAANTTAQQALEQQRIAQTGATTGLGAEQTIAGRGLTGATSVLNAGVPREGQYGVPVFNPLTGTYTYPQGGQYGTGPEASANVQTVKDYTTKKNDLDATISAADSNFNILNSYAQGFDSQTPIVSGLSQLYGTTAQGNEAVAGFKAQLQNVRSAYTAITGGDAVQAIPDNITPAQLQQVQSALKNTAQNIGAGYQAIIDKFNTQTPSGSTGGTMFGSFF